MTIVEIMQFFKGFLNQDPLVLKRINAAGENVLLGDGELIFSLQGLYRLTDPKQGHDFPGFRKMLYSSSLNRDLRSLDAEIVLYQSSGKLATNLYCLRRISKL
jgi:hypothetical protein